MRKTTGASRRQRRPMTDIGVGGVTRTVARASDLSGARRTKFLFYRFVVERRRRRRFSRRRRTVAVAPSPSLSSPLVTTICSGRRIQTRASRRTHAIARARVRTSDAITRRGPSGRGLDRLDGQLVRPSFSILYYVLIILLLLWMTAY